MNKSNQLQIMSLGLDEDSKICFDHQPLATYKYRGYINNHDDSNMMCNTMVYYDQEGNRLPEPVVLTIDNAIESILGGTPGNLPDDSNGAFLAETIVDPSGQTELARFMDLVEDMKKMQANLGGVLVTWAVEYDNNVALIYCGTTEEINEWLHRPYDESEFED